MDEMDSAEMTVPSMASVDPSRSLDHHHHHLHLQNKRVSVSFDDVQSGQGGGDRPLLPLRIDSDDSSGGQAPVVGVAGGGGSLAVIEDEADNSPRDAPEAESSALPVKSITARLRVKMSIGMYENQDVKFASGVKVVGQQFKTVSSNDDQDQNTVTSGGSDEKAGQNSSGNEMSRATSRGESSTFYYQSGLDDISERMQINWNEFSLCLFHHLLFPLSIPLILIFDGRYLAYNYAFIPQTFLQFTFWFQIMQVLLLSSPLVYMIWRPEYISKIEILAPLCLYVAHKMMVSTKYAMQTPEFTKKLRKEIISSEVHFSIMLVSGWHNPNQRLVHSLLEKASDCLLIDFRKMTFSVYHQRHDLTRIAPRQAIVSGQTVNLNDEEAVSQLNASEYCKFLTDVVFDFAYKTFGKMRIPFQFFFALMFAVTPEAVRAVQGQSTWNQDSRSMWYVVIVSMLGSGFYASTIVSFDFVSLVDIFRRYALLTIVKDIIDPLSTSNFFLRIAGRSTIHIDITNEKNLGTWAAIRELFLFLGLSFRKRCDIYKAYVLMSSCVVAVFMIISLMDGKPDWTLVIAISTVLLFIIVSIVVHVVLGSLLNNAYEEIHDSLVRVQYIVRDSITHAHDGSCKDQTRLEVFVNTDKVLSNLIEVVRLEEKQAAATILGFKLTGDTVRLIIGFFVFAVTIVYYTAKAKTSSPSGP